VELVLEDRRGEGHGRMLDRPPVSALVASATARAPDAANEDAALVEAVLGGERAAEETLYRRHAPGVLRLATRLLRSHDDALDVLQDAFVTALEDLASLRDRAAFRAWLHRITVRLVHRRFRRRKLLALLGLDRKSGDISLESLADERASADARVELRWLDRALSALDDKTRIAWMLRHVEGLSLDETAAACDCSLATVKRRIASADARVKEHLHGIAGEGAKGEVRT
jgi:RNA polymerase sigma-70 factor, ECF subfamily